MAAKPQRAVNKSAAGARPAAPTGSLRARLAAWWEGAPAPAAAPVARGGKTTPTSKIPPLPELWTAQRIAAANLLWSESFVTPVRAEAVAALAAPLDLQTGDTLLDAAAGLGGAAHALAARHQLRATALEPSAALVAAGAALAKAQGWGKAVALSAYDPRSDEFARGPYAAAVANELVFTIEDKEGLLARLVRAVRPQGRILIGDYVLAGSAPGPALAAWQAADPALVRPWRIDDARKCLAKLKVDITAAVDETSRLRALITGGLEAFAAGAAAGAVSPALAAPLAREVALWAARKHALDGGEIQFVALYGVRTGDGA